MSDAADDYFQPLQEGAAIDPSFAPLFASQDDIPYVNLGKGIRFKPIFGRNLLFNYVFFEPHTEAPMHAHAEEQIGTMLEGEYEFEMNGEKRMIRPGDVYVVPPNVPHAARTFEHGCIAVDIFSPPRSGFREMLDRVTGAQDAGD
ncbi:MAG TPA: cupin domain-containing protein [Chloroflexota bacterium]|jgi:quercetin dioxygenase-like cupin family protein